MICTISLGRLRSSLRYKRLSSRSSSLCFSFSSLCYCSISSRSLSSMIWSLTVDVNLLESVFGPGIKTRRWTKDCSMFSLPNPEYSYYSVAALPLDSAHWLGTLEHTAHQELLHIRLHFALTFRIAHSMACTGWELFIWKELLRSCTIFGDQAYVTGHCSVNILNCLAYTSIISSSISWYFGAKSQICNDNYKPNCAAARISRSV